MISQKEYEVLKGLDDKWKWITRVFGDHGGSLFAYLEKPYKRDVGVWHYGRGVHHIDNRLFQFIQWEDSEPYNIQELIEDYENENGIRYDFGKIKLVDIDTSKLVAHNGFVYAKESEETEIKDINPLMKYVNREIETIKDILSHMDREESEGGNEWLEGFLSALEKVRDKLNKLDEPEVLSQELPVIPKFVAEWFEENKENFESKLKSIIKYPPQYDEDVTDFTKWVSNPVNKPIQTLGNMFNGYEVEEKEQKYIVKLPLPGDRTDDFAVVDIYGDIWLDDEWPSQCKMTEKEIKALPKGEVYFEHFAVKVEEMEQ